jgi:hypothetical protein
MRQFKFFQKPVKGDLTMMDGQTRASASFHGEFPPLQEWDTPQGHYDRRRLYHTNPAEYERQRQIREDLRTVYRTNELTQEEMLRVRHQAFQRMRNTNDDMERYFIENGFRNNLNDNRTEPLPVTKPKSNISNFIDWGQKYEHLIPIFIGLGIIATFMIYFR